jgi:hypothetical protein
MVALMRQSVFSRLAGYKDINDAERLSCHDFVDNQVRLLLFALHTTRETFFGRQCCHAR